MVIVEGPDGAGKTTLIEHLAKQFELPRHFRHADSTQGPLGDMYNWGANDIMSWPSQELSIYDRHPFISDPIYAPVIRKTYDPRFYETEGRAIFHDMVHNSLVIFCDPGYAEVKANLTNAAQMDGVVDNIRMIHTLYAMTFARWPRLEPMHASSYDYQRPTDLRKIESMVEYHLKWATNAAGKKQHV